MTVKDLMKELNITTDELVKTGNLYGQEVFGDTPWMDKPVTITADEINESLEDTEDNTPVKFNDDGRVYVLDSCWRQFLIHTVHGWLLDWMPGDYSAVILHNDTFILSGHDGTCVYDLIPAHHDKKRWASECFH